MASGSWRCIGTRHCRRARPPRRPAPRSPGPASRRCRSSRGAEASPSGRPLTERSATPSCSPPRRRGLRRDARCYGDDRMKLTFLTAGAVALALAAPAFAQNSVTTIEKETITRDVPAVEQKTITREAPAVEHKTITRDRPVVEEKTITKDTTTVTEEPASGSTVATTTVIAPMPPPPPEAEAPPPPPMPTAVWTPGHWRWTVEGNRYVWVSGKY